MKNQEILIIGILLVLLLFVLPKFGAFTFIPSHFKDSTFNGVDVSVSSNMEFGSGTNCRGDCATEDKPGEWINNADGLSIYIFRKQLNQGATAYGPMTQIKTDNLKLSFKNLKKVTFKGSFSTSSNRDGSGDGSELSIDLDGIRLLHLLTLAPENTPQSHGDVVLTKIGDDWFMGTKKINIDEDKEYELRLYVATYGYGASGGVQTITNSISEIIVEEVPEDIPDEDDEDEIPEDEEPEGIICLEGFTYNENTELCEKYPETETICLEGTYNPDTEKCEIYPEIEEWYSKTLFEINEFEVKMWMLLIGIGALLLLMLSGRRR